MSVAEAEIVQSVPANALILNPALTAKQSLFVQYFIETRNGVKSARLAGYNGDDSILRSLASENLTKPHIRQAIENHFASLAIGSNETLAELGAIARFDVLSNPDSPIRTSDKLKALELAGKYHQLWDKPDGQTNVQVNVNSDSLTVILQTVLSELNLTESTT